jgi:hypothetical protein
MTQISIHVPRQGTTDTTHCHRSVGIVSIHAPTLGATKIDANHSTGKAFQPTSSHKARRQSRECSKP